MRNALRAWQSEAELRNLRALTQREIIGESKPMQELLRQITKVGGTRARVLIEGVERVAQLAERRGASTRRSQVRALPQSPQSPRVASGGPAAG